MNYQKIYDALILKARITGPLERITQRSSGADIRCSLATDVYTEQHHVIPKHAGGTNDSSNIVTLLPEEHFLAHLLLYKINKSRHDFLAVRFCLNGWQSKKFTKLSPEQREYLHTLAENKRIGVFKQLIYSFRKEYGWQSAEGRSKIAEARRGKFPAVDKHGNSVGSIRKDHPKLISGEWKHHSKGKTSATNLLTGERVFVDVTQVDRSKFRFNSGRNQKHVNNPNYKEMTPEIRSIVIQIGIKLIKNDKINVRQLDTALKEMLVPTHFNKISYVWIINRFGSIENFINECKG